MATIRRAGFGTVFELEDSKVGIGTDAATHTLQALGNIRSEAATDIGISSLSTYQGFTDKEARFTGGQIDIQSQSGATSGEIIIDGDVTVSSATTFTSGPQHLTVTDTFTLPSGDTNSRELKPTPGSLRFNQDFATLEFYTGNNWATVNAFTDIKTNPQGRGRGVFQGGREGPNPFQIIDFINISSLGNATTFGDSLNSCMMSGGMSSSIRGLFAGGYSPTALDVIEYITIASEGNSIDFGDMSEELHALATLSSSTRGINAGGDTGPSVTDKIEYVEINTLGNTLDFGDLSQAAMRLTGGMNSTRGLILGGSASAGHGGTMKSNFITMASKGDGTEFGTLNPDRTFHGTASNSVRVLSGGGYHNSISGGLKIIDSLTTASLGNAIPFGDLMTGRYALSATGNQTRAVFVGGTDGTTDNWNVIEFVNFASSGNAQDFGDLSVGRYSPSALSDSHGGLGGF